MCKSQPSSEIIGPTTWEGLKRSGAALPPGSSEVFSEPVTNVFVLSSFRIILAFHFAGAIIKRGHSGVMSWQKAIQIMARFLDWGFVGKIKQLH